MGWFFPSRKKPALSRQQALSAKPFHTVDAKIEPDERGGATIRVPLRSDAKAWIFRIPEGSTKTFELDPLGLFVWESCDGKTSVQQIIRKLSRQYNLNLREAEVATVKFFQMLMKKGLIAMPIKQEQAGTK
jgi:hypothetical protein